MAGWTLAYDVPAHPDLGLLEHLDEEVVVAGGRVYRWRDSWLHPRLLPAMYPWLDEFRRARGSTPTGCSAPDLARRLEI